MGLFFFFRRSGPVAASEADSYHALGAHSEDFPLYLVEIAFADSPLEPDPTWVDVSEYVRGLSVRRGRSDELARVETGTLSIVLDNRDRRFDPTYTDGPYYPNVLPMRQVRVRAYWDGVAYPIYRGFVEAWPQSWPEHGKDAVVEVTAFDALGLLTLQTTEAAYRETLLRDGPVGYWRLGESGGAVAADETENGNDGVFVGAPTLGADGLLAGDANGAVSFSEAGEEVRIPHGASLAIADTFSITCWLKLAAGAAGPIAEKGGSSGGFTFYTADGQNVYLSSGGTDIATSSIGLAADTVYHVAVTKSGATTRIYLNGADSTVAGSNVTLVATTSDLRLGFDFVASAAFTLDEVAVWDRALTADEVYRHYLAGSAQVGLETAAVRLGRLLDLAEWPTGLRDLDTGQTSPLVAGAAPSGSVLDAVQSIAQAETGLVYADAGGTVVFADRARRWLANADGPAGVLGDGGGSEVPIAEIVAGYDVNAIRNHVLVTPAGGTAVTASDTASQAAYYRRSLELSLLTSDTNEAEAIAAGLLGRFAEPQLRVESVSLVGGSGTAIWPHVLGSDLGARYTVRRRPPAGGTIETSVYLEAVSHDVAPGPVWTTTWQMSPADADSYWILEDATFGVLDSTTRLAY